MKKRSLNSILMERDGNGYEFPFRNCPIWFKCDGKTLMAPYIYRYTDVLLSSVRLVGFLFRKYIDPGNVMTNNIIVDAV